MYIVICSDKSNIDMSEFKPYEMSDSVFGPFSTKEDAEEWVDDHCGRSYWIIVKLRSYYQ